MSVVFDLRKLPVLDVVVIAKITDQSASLEEVQRNIQEIAELSVVGVHELVVKQVKIQILVLDLRSEVLMDDHAFLSKSIGTIAGATCKRIGPFDSRRDEKIATYREAFRYPFAILVEVPTINAGTAKNVLDLLRPIVDGADFVVGERPLRIPLFSYVKLRLLNSYFWLRFGYPVNDWTTEYLSWRHWAISNVEYKTLTSPGIGYLAELKNRCLDKGFRSRSILLEGEPSEKEFDFLQGFWFFNEARGIRSTL